MARVNIGDRFDKLEVIEKAEKVPSVIKWRDENGKIHKKEGKTKYQAWLCKCDCGKKVVVKQVDLIKERAYLRSCGECPKEENPDYVPSGMTEEEKDEWDALYEYVRTNIMNYDKNQALSKYIVVRLKGLTVGNYIINDGIKKKANYSFTTILNTFKFCSPDIQRGLRNSRFKDEQHKFNYVCKIVESNINNVYIRMKNAEQTKKDIENDTEAARALSYVNTFKDKASTKAKNDTPRKAYLYEHLR